MIYRLKSLLHGVIASQSVKVHKRASILIHFFFSWLPLDQQLHHRPRKKNGNKISKKLHLCTYGWMTDSRGQIADITDDLDLLRS